MVVSNIVYVHPYLGKIPILTNIFEMGWNHQLDIAGEELFQLHGLHDLRGVKKKPNVQVIMLGQDGRFYRFLFGDWQGLKHLRNIFMIILYVYIYIYLKTNTNTSKNIGVNIDIKREHKYRYDHRYTAEYKYKNTYR